MQWQQCISWNNLLDILFHELCRASKDEVNNQKFTLVYPNLNICSPFLKAWSFSVPELDTEQTTNYKWRWKPEHFSLVSSSWREMVGSTENVNVPVFWTVLQNFSTHTCVCLSSPKIYDSWFQGCLWMCLLCMLRFQKHDVELLI